MQFMIMMIPAVYRDNKMDKKFVPDPKKFRRWDDSMKNYRSK